MISEEEGTETTTVETASEMSQTELETYLSGSDKAEEGEEKTETKPEKKKTKPSKKSTPKKTEKDSIKTEEKIDEKPINSEPATQEPVTVSIVDDFRPAKKGGKMPEDEEIDIDDELKKLSKANKADDLDELEVVA